MTQKGDFDHILETGDRILKDRLWAKVRLEDTKNMKINIKQSRTIDYRTRESCEDGESVSVPGKKSERI